MDDKVPVTAGVHHIGLTVADLEASAGFFTGILGWHEVRRDAEYPAIFVSDGTVMVTLWRAQVDTPVDFNKDANIGLHHLALGVGSEPALKSLYQKLLAAGVTVEFAPEPLRGGPAMHMMCYDPGGIRIEFVYVPWMSNHSHYCVAIEGEQTMPLTKKLGAEFIGTFWLVLGGCGSAVLAAAFPELGIGFMGVALAFGLTVLTMVYAIGHISGCHLNPAVSLGLWSGGRFPTSELLPYIIVQVAGGIAGATVLYLIATGKAGFDVSGGFASNGYGEHSPGGYSMSAALVAEVAMTFMFLIIILGATDKRAPAGFAGIAIGLGLTLIHLISIPVTNTSVNPARSTAVAIFVGDWATAQLWLFWVAPFAGALLAGIVYRWLGGEEQA